MRSWNKKRYLLATLTIVGILSAIIPANAEMKRLSEFQNGIFHLSPKYYPDSEFDKSDQYIDDEQAEVFIAAARVDIHLPADHDNYPYSLVDHQITDDDLEIFHSTKGRSILRPYPRTLYLSRHNISIEEYTSMKEPPAVFIRKMTKSREPFGDKPVQGVAWQFNNSRIYQAEVIRPIPGPGKDNIHLMLDAEVVTIRGVVAVWKDRENLILMPSR